MKGALNSNNFCPDFKEATVSELVVDLRTETTCCLHIFSSVNTDRIGLTQPEPPETN